MTPAGFPATGVILLKLDRLIDGVTGIVAGDQDCIFWFHYKTKWPEVNNKK